jgi:hypothetical protein
LVAVFFAFPFKKIIDSEILPWHSVDRWPTRPTKTKTKGDETMRTIEIKPDSIPSTYSIEATGDVVRGDEIAFERATFTGSYRRPKFAGNELVVGTVVSDSYGAAKQQHTFTIELENGQKIHIKGRNVYRNGVWRKPWRDESKRDEVADEKHRRGDKARAERDYRMSGYESAIY